MGLIVFPRGEKGLVGRDQRQFVEIGEIDGLGLDHAVVAGDTLQFDIEAVAENLFQRQEAGFGKMGVVGLYGRAYRPARPASQANQVVAVFSEPAKRDMDRFSGRVFEIGPADQPDQIAVAVLVRGDQHDWKEFGSLPLLVAAIGIIVLVPEGNVELAADNRLDALLDRLLCEFQCAEEVVRVGYRDGRGRILDRMIDDLREGQRAFEQRIGGMDAQMHERPRRSFRLRRSLHRFPQNRIARRLVARHVFPRIRRRTCRSGLLFETSRF